MNIRKTIIVLLVALLGMNLNAQNPISIVGTLLNNNGKYENITLKLAYGDRKEYAQAPIGADGKFAITTTLPAADIYSLSLDDNNTANLAFYPGDKITFTAEASSIANLMEITGSSSVKFVKRNADLLQRNQLLVDSLNKELQTDKIQQSFNNLFQNFNLYHQSNQDIDRHIDTSFQYAISLENFQKSMLVKESVPVKVLPDYLSEGSKLTKVFLMHYTAFQNYLQNVGIYFNFTSDRVANETALYTQLDNYQDHRIRQNQTVTSIFDTIASQLSAWSVKRDGKMFEPNFGKKEQTALANELTQIINQMPTDLAQRQMESQIMSVEQDQLGSLMMNTLQTKSSQRLAVYQNEYNRASEQNNEAIKKDIIANKNDLATLMFIDIFPMDQNPDLHEEVVAALYARYPNNLIVKSKHDAISTTAIRIGSMAPDLAFNSPDGKILKLSDLRGKVVLLDFWASWCRPCRMENPNVVAAYKKYNDQGFEVFSVSLDKDKNSWIKAIADDHLIWPNHVSDLKYWSSEAAAIYGVRSIPETYLIDRNGRIVAKNPRGEALVPALEKLLKQ